MSAGLVTQAYTSFQRGGVTSIVAASLITILSILILFGTAPRNRHPQTNIFAYWICLLVANIIQCVGTAMSARWVAENRIVEDTFCSFQGAVKQLGNVGTAFWTFMIAFHLFNLLFLRSVATTRIVSTATIVAGWAIVLVVVIAGPAVIQKPTLGPYFGISGDWCWITDAYPAEQTYLEYFFEYLAAALGLIFYSLILLRIRGNLTAAKGKWHLRFVPSGQSWQLNVGRDAIDASMTKVARTMVWYPVAYTFVLVPITAVRLTEFAGGSVPEWAFIPTDIIFNLTGFVNVMLFLLTRRIFPDAEELDLSQPRQELSPTFAATGGVVPFTLGADYGKTVDEEVGFGGRSSKRFTVDSITPLRGEK